MSFSVSRSTPFGSPQLLPPGQSPAAGSVLAGGMQPAPHAASGSSPKRCRPALSTAHELVLWLQRPLQPRPRGRGFKARRAGDTGGSGNAKKMLWRARFLGIDARQSQAPKSAWRNASEALCSSGLQRSRVLQQGLGAPAGPCRDSRVPVLAWRHRRMGSSGCCRAQRSGFPEHGRLAKAGRPWEATVGLHRELQKAGAWSEKALSHPGLSAEPAARASAVPAKTGHCWRDRAEMSAPRAPGGLPNRWSHLPF